MACVDYVETQGGAIVKVVRTHRGGEYLNTGLDDWFRQKGIVHETSVPYTPQQNGVAETLNRTMFDQVRAMLQASGLGKKFWAEAVMVAN